MQLTLRHLALLACIAGAGAWAWSLRDGHGDPVMAPATAASQPAPSVPTTAAAPVPHHVAAGASAALPQPALQTSVSAAPPVRLPAPDVSRRQREIQLALGSDRPGSAGAAAQHIQTCQALEESREWNEANRHRRAEADYRRALANLAEDLPACQAIDAASRAQLLPLLRRSLAEGDKGAAARLAMQLRDRFDPAAEPDIVAGLRRDAWVCDRLSIITLMNLARQHPQLLTLTEVGALREKERAWTADMLKSIPGAGSALDPARQSVLDKLMDSLKPPPGADPAEVARLAAAIQSHCTAPP